MFGEVLSYHGDGAVGYDASLSMKKRTSPVLHDAPAFRAAEAPACFARRMSLQGYFSDDADGATSEQSSTTTISHASSRDPMIASRQAPIRACTVVVGNDDRQGLFCHFTLLMQDQTLTE